MKVILTHHCHSGPAKGAPGDVVDVPPALAAQLLAARGAKPCQPHSPRSPQPQPPSLSDELPPDLPPDLGDEDNAPPADDTTAAQPADTEGQGDNEAPPANEPTAKQRRSRKR